MKVTPQITADVEEYPELRRLLNMVLRPVVDIMGAHAIASIRRMRKVGVFDHPYEKDSVAGMNIPGVPQTVKASQYAVGKALLDYLSAIGVSGVMIEATAEELQGIAGVWMPRECNAGPAAKPDKPDKPEEPQQDKPAEKPEAQPEQAQEPVQEQKEEQDVEA